MAEVDRNSRNTNDCFGLFRDMPRNQRSVREQVNKLLKDYKNKKNKDEQTSGIKPDPLTETEVFLGNSNYKRTVINAAYEKHFWAS